MVIEDESEWFRKYDLWYDNARDSVLWRNSIGIHDWLELKAFRNANDQRNLLRLMNTIWAYLPDDKFNIRVNPPYWYNFLTLIEV